MMKKEGDNLNRTCEKKKRFVPIKNGTPKCLTTLEGEPLKYFVKWQIDDERMVDLANLNELPWKKI